MLTMYVRPLSYSLSLGIEYGVTLMIDRYLIGDHLDHSAVIAY